MLLIGVLVVLGIVAMTGLIGVGPLRERRIVLGFAFFVAALLLVMTNRIH